MSLDDEHDSTDLHADAMALAYDDLNEWQGRCPAGYKANLLAERIEDLVIAWIQRRSETPESRETLSVMPSRHGRDTDQPREDR